MSQRLVQILGRGLDSDVRFRFERAVEAMWRDLRYTEAKRGEALRKAEAAGWSSRRIETVIVLNAFNRIVMAPLALAYEAGLKSGIGLTIPVKFGETISVDAASGAGPRAALVAYRAILKRLAIREYWLNLPTCSDLVFTIGGRDEDGDDQ